MLKSIANLLKTIPVRAFATTSPTRARNSEKVHIKMRAAHLNYLKAPVLSQEEFAKKYCSSFDEFVSKNGALIQKVGVSSQDAFKRMIDVSYENYLRHQSIVEPGRIF